MVLVNGDIKQILVRDAEGVGVPVIGPVLKLRMLSGDKGSES
jgi:hypothetical protein